jgi:hypothetical protein
MKLKNIQYVLCTLFHIDVHALVQQYFRQIFNVDAHWPSKASTERGKDKEGRKEGEVAIMSVSARKEI